MKKVLKISVLMLVIGFIFGLTGCPDPDSDNINWDDQPNGTLAIINTSSKDMVIFQGQTPTSANILGGVRANTERTFEISDKVSDFNIGGYMILRGITLDEYNANKSNLSNAKIEYSAMATYGQGKKFRTEISANYIGDFGFKVNNRGNIGMELRKNSPDGEKIGYLPRLATNQVIYADSSSAFTVYPVYVYYSKTSGTITTLEPSTLFDTVLATPRPLTDPSMQTYYFPVNPIDWSSVASTLISPTAYLTVVNNFTQGLFFTIAGGSSLKAQNGYDAVGSGEQLTFEMVCTVDGADRNLVIVLFGGTIQVPVRFEGQANIPKIRNGYDYTITLNFKGGFTSDPANYEAIIVEGSKRDITDEIISL